MTKWLGTNGHAPLRLQSGVAQPIEHLQESCSGLRTAESILQRSRQHVQLAMRPVRKKHRVTRCQRARERKWRSSVCGGMVNAFKRSVRLLQRLGRPTQRDAHRQPNQERASNDFVVSLRQHPPLKNFAEENRCFLWMSAENIGSTSNALPFLFHEDTERAECFSRKILNTERSENGSKRED